MNRSTVLILVLFLAAVFYFGYLLPKRTGIQVGDEAPAFALTDAQGKIVHLADYRGKFILLNFWATWCPPCVWEMPSLERLSQDLAEEGLVVLAVSIDEGGWDTILSFQQKIPVSFQLLWDETTDVAAEYGTFQLPETYLIGQGGTVLKKYQGAREWDDAGLTQEIRSLIRANGEGP